MNLHRFTESSSEFKQKRLIFQDATGTIEHAPSAPDTKSQLRVLSLSIIMAMKYGGKYELGDFKNWPKERQENHYRNLAQTMPKSFNEELFFSAKNPFLRDLEVNVGLYTPDGMNTDDIVEAIVEKDGTAKINFEHGRTQEWVRFEPQHTVIQAIKWMEEQLKSEPNPTEEQVKTIVGTIRQLKEHEGESATDLIDDEASPPKLEQHKVGNALAKYVTQQHPGDLLLWKILAVSSVDRDTLGKAKLEDIRQKNQLLVEGKAENGEQKKSFLVEETARRMQAYCEEMADGWFKLNYSRVGGDLHLDNVGLGDILLDPDIEEVEIKTKSGKIFTAHRGIVESGKHKGRQAFIADGKPYVDTYDGDMFRIKSTTPLETPAYIQKAEAEQKARETRPVTISTKTETGKGRSKVEQEINENPITYKSLETQIKGSNLTVKMIKDAETEAAGPTEGPSKEKAFEQVLNRPNFMAVVNYAAKQVGVPPWIILAVMFRESRFNYLVQNKEDEEERGIGQFKKSAWISTRGDESFISTMEQVINEDPRKMERQRSILADTLAIAITIKRALKAGGNEGVSYLTHLDPEQLEKIRWFYHVPSYFKCIQKNGQGYSAAFYEKAKAFLAKTQSRENAGKYGYKNFADNALEIETAWKAKFKTDSST